MRGPFERLKYDLRRIWECPACGQRRRTDGTTTTQFCTCGKSNSAEATSMKLIGDGPRRTVPVIAKPRPAPSPVAVIETTQVNVIATEVASTTVVESVTIATTTTVTALPAEEPLPPPASEQPESPESEA
ncbi:hypothetical protein ETAA8_07430 [Anatilimnocola aggregata]|uniref:Uncharacterized protein n=1 Tax=Anatilimnocola aggregata TaxID=2528021 RepID=A0A517Y613_9BACT|nr:hypothetical protein [Anatilimnocola aggregata]QDU25673.1 hypothetical protein ETAA8_07430 [Anatilimnocola aggregata]